MDENVEELKQEVKDGVKKKIRSQAKKQDKAGSKKVKFSIFGISIWRIFAYFIIYSIVGYIVETVFGVVTKGLLESRKSFLYGPFCAIYGLGAVIMIVCLQKFKKNHNTLFFGGFIIGSIIEYLVSLIGELILHVKWWDYSNMPLNLDGRVCVYFSIFWGFLALYLMISFNPKIDRLIDWIKSKVNTKVLKSVIVVTIIAMLIDCIITGYAIMLFMIRMIEVNDIQVENREAVSCEYNKIYGDEDLANFIYKYWGDKKMIMTFPNLKIEDKDGNIVYFDSFLKDIQPYYLKIYDKKF